MTDPKTAVLYRMVLPDHTCPFGVRAKEMLEAAGYQVEDHVLRSRGEVDAFEKKVGVETTPQVYIDGERVGGSDDLERYLASKAANPSHAEIATSGIGPIPLKNSRLRTC